MRCVVEAYGSEVYPETYIMLKYGLWYILQLPDLLAPEEELSICTLNPIHRKESFIVITWESEILWNQIMYRSMDNYSYE